MRLVLASRSPRRAELLARIGLPFEILAAEVDESPLPYEAAADYVVRLARAKAEEASRYIVGAASRPRSQPTIATGRSLPQDRRSLPQDRRPLPQDIVCLGADTAVILDERILGKPADEVEGVDMLLALSGRGHRVMSGVAVCGAGGTRCRCVATEVRFRVIEPWEARAYWRTGEGADKAGGYGIQGIGGIFAETIRGSYSAVVGLPLAETEQLLRESGLDTWRERTHG